MVKFVVAQSRTYWWPVKVRIPNPDAKKASNITEHSFKVKFEDVGTEEANSLLNIDANLPAEERAAHQHDLLLRVVVDWDEDIVGEDGEPVPFATETLRALLDDARLATAIWRAWGDSQRDEGGRRKN